MKANIYKPYFITFFVPLWGLFIGLKNITEKSYHYFILFFAFWFGYSVIFNEGSDHTAYKETYAEVINYDWEDFYYLTSHALSVDRLINLDENAVNSKPDLFALTLMFLNSRITDNPRWFFALISLIYFYFFLSFKTEVLIYTGYHQNKYWRIVFLFILLILPFHVGVTGVRFWTALFYLLWMFLKYLNTKKKTYLYLIWLCLLIHYSYTIPCVLITVFVNIKFSYRYVKPFLPLLILLYFISTTTSLTYISSVLNVFEETSVKGATEAYTDVDLLNDRKVDNNSANWYVRLREFAINNFFVLFYLLELAGIIKFDNNNNNKIDSITFVFLLLTLLTAGLGSIGRFKYLFYLFSLVRLLKIIDLETNLKKIKKYYYIISSILILHVLVSTRGAFYVVDPLLVFGHPILFLFDIHSTTSLSELIVGH